MLDEASNSFYIRSHSHNRATTLRVEQSPSNVPPPRDDIFLELLFNGVCQRMRDRPGENVVQKMQRWSQALACMAAMEPRNEQEWLQAADVTTKQYDALHSLALYLRKGRRSSEQRLANAGEFVLQVKATQEARLRYETLRGAPDAQFCLMTDRRPTAAC